MSKFYDRLAAIYDTHTADQYSKELESLVYAAKNKLHKKIPALTEKDVALITYGDQFFEDNEKTLKTFYTFAAQYLKDVFTTIHFLPFYPYSSDDGFSVIFYEQIDERLGSWEDIFKISQEYKLMFDFVCNHISAKSEWFSKYLSGEADYKDFFIEVDPAADLSLVTRPRTLPLLTEFMAANGDKKQIWTTFSEDQIDLNFGNPKVLLKMIEIFLDYIIKGAAFIRMDAVGYLWKEIGTSCIHLRKTHEIIKLFRNMTDELESGTKIVTETNVPYKDNISYFGNGHDESHMVYQFPLPPLMLYTYISQNSANLTKWAGTLTLPPSPATYFNFLASHDGVGINPIRGIVSDEEIANMIEELQQECGALVSYKQNADGSKSPYEINVSYVSALGHKVQKEDEWVQKVLNAHHILLSLAGLPAIYIHSLLGSANDLDGVKKQGRNRAINREKNDYKTISSQLRDSTSFRNKIYNGIVKLIGIRKTYKAFAPSAKQEILSLSDKVFAIKRISREEEILCISNISNAVIHLQPDSIEGKINLITAKQMQAELVLKPYEFVWVKL